MLAIATILHPTDFSDCSQAAFRIACSLAREHQARLVLLHVTAVPDLAYEGFGAPAAALAADEYLEKTKKDLEDLKAIVPCLNTEYRLEEGDPGTEIVNVAGNVGAELIVMGTHGRKGLGHLLMGSVAEYVVRKAPCSVMTMKAS
jgi:nucleotide-binding universal stress UspA family protein